MIFKTKKKREYSTTPSFFSYNYNYKKHPKLNLKYVQGFTVGWQLKTSLGAENGEAHLVKLNYNSSMKWINLKYCLHKN